MGLTKLAMRRPVSTALVVLALVVFGLTSVVSFKLELTPDMELPMLLVYTIYAGADPESVEELVTKEDQLNTSWSANLREGALISIQASQDSAADSAASGEE